MIFFLTDAEKRYVRRVDSCDLILCLRNVVDLFSSFSCWRKAINLFSSFPSLLRGGGDGLCMNPCRNSTGCIQNSASMLRVRIIFSDQIPEADRVIHFRQMASFMNNDISDDLFWKKQQRRIQCDAPFCRTGSPDSALESDRESGELKTQFGTDICRKRLQFHQSFAFQPVSES